MTTTNVTAAQARAGLVYPAGYIWAGSTITYSVPGAGALWESGYGRGEVSNAQYGTLNGTQAASFVSAIEIWDSYIRPSMNQVSDATPGQIRVAFTDVTAIENNPNVAAYAYSPPPPGGSASASNGDVWIDETLKGDAFAARSQSFALLLHELGHSLGLKHPFQSPTLPAGYDNKIYTVMSYTNADYFYKFSSGGGSIFVTQEGTVDFTPMVLDILAIQGHYGADTGTAVGDTKYVFNDASLNGRQAIYDASGTDTIDLSALSRGSFVDLRPGAYSDIAYYSVEDQIDDLSAQHGEGFRPFITSQLTNPNAPAYEWTKNVGIAFSTTIENVIGSASADDVYGNNANNAFALAGGADTMRGLGGNDTYQVLQAGDRVIEAANGGTDTVRAFITYTLGANVENLTLSGTTAISGSGNTVTNVIHGNAANNALNGREGNDILQGFGGRDTFMFNTTITTTNIDRVRDFSTVDDFLKLDDAIFSQLNVGTLTASQFKNIATGTADSDDRILYDRDTGYMFYDANGSAAGQRYMFAIIENKVAVTNADILVY